jgi:hypothetical protein
MESALIALAGVLTGMVLTEYYRRLSRIEKYSSTVFDKRLEIYERFLRLLHSSANKVRDVIEEPSLTEEAAHEQVMAATLKLMHYCDRHPLFIHQEITVHCGAVFTGALDVIEMPPQERPRGLDAFNRGVRQAIRMITAESGVEELNKLFRAITNSDPNSDIVLDFRKKNRQSIAKDARMRSRAS